MINSKKYIYKSSKKIKTYGIFSYFYQTMKYLLIFSFLLIFISCKKETVLDTAPSLVGSWIHYSDIGNSHLIYIYDNGEGKMEWFVDYEKVKFTKVRTWYIKDNTIYFGKIALNGELYEVIEFPSTSSTQTIENYDTLKVGKRFMLLDEGYFVEI